MVSKFQEANQLLRTGNLKEAAAVYRLVIEENPGFYWSYHNLGETLCKLKRLDEAVEAFRQAVGVNPGAGWSHFCLGQVFAKQQQWEKAIASYQQALGLQLHQPEVFYELGIALAGLKRWDEAVEAYQKAIERDETQHKYYHHLGDARLRQGELEEAIACYQKALELNPISDWSHYNLGQALEKLGRTEEAIASYRQAINLGFDQAEVRLYLGYAFSQLGRYEEAAVELRKAVELYPGSAVVWQQLGDVLRGLGENEEAVGVYQKALEIEPKSAEVLEHLGNTLHQLGLLDEAIAAFRGAVWVKPNIVRVHDKLAALSHEKSQQKKAEIRTQKPQTLKYHSPTIEELTQQQKQLYETVGVEKTNVQIKSEDPWEVPHKLADILRDRGELDKAVEAYRYAIDLNPSNVHSYQNLGDVLQQQDKKEQAAIAHAQGIELNPNHFKASKYRPGETDIPIEGKWNARRKIRRVAVIGNYLPRKCGIATFTTDLCNALSKVDEDLTVLAVAINDSDSGYNYPSRVAFEIEQNSITSYRRAADFLNQNDIDVVCLQHEYGIFGGSAGRHILTLLERLRIPIFVTLHTVIQKPLEDQHLVIEELGRLCNKLVVMSERGKTFLQEGFNIPSSKIEMIYHGVHDVPFTDSSTHKDKFSLRGKNVILTFGLLGRNKGIEYAIQAMPKVIEQFPNTIYLCVGATHPHLVKHEGEIYRESLVKLATELGVAKNTIFVNQFLELDELIEYIGAADIYLTPYLSKGQITSGTLAYTVSAGKAVISTPYWHAEELLADGRGILVPFRNSEAIASEILNLLKNPEELNSIRKRAYIYGRQMTWLAVARRYMETFVNACYDRQMLSVKKDSRHG
jgi:tetratricopeptide (TPR) repeat protein